MTGAGIRFFGTTPRATLAFNSLNGKSIIWLAKRSVAETVMRQASLKSGWAIWGVSPRNYIADRKAEGTQGENRGRTSVRTDVCFRHTEASTSDGLNSARRGSSDQAHHCLTV